MDLIASWALLCEWQAIGHPVAFAIYAENLDKFVTCSDVGARRRERYRDESPPTALRERFFPPKNRLGVTDIFA
jgi:hypothetical protein